MLISIYRPPDQNLDYFLSIISDTLDFDSNFYDRFIFMGNFNALPTSILISRFTADHCLVNLIKTPTCFKSKHGTCIDLIVINKKYIF